MLDSNAMFRLLDRYLIREIVPYILLGLLLLTAIIFAQESSRFSELLVVASRNGLPMATLWRLMSALIPGIFVFTLPISLLIGTLVGLGRLSGEGFRAERRRTLNTSIWAVNSTTLVNQRVREF